MGADLYNSRYRERQPNLVAAREKIVSMRQGEITDENREEYIETYAASEDALSYFRDSYNDSSVLWQLGLSWWNDIIPLEISYTEEQTEEFNKNDSWPDVNLDANGCRTFLAMILSAEPTFIAAMAECDPEAREYFVSRRDTLIAFLTQGIEDGGICASL
jgi:hypothetical protein